MFDRKGADTRVLEQIRHEEERDGYIRKNILAFHGQPALQEALHIGTYDYDYRGKKALILGYPMGRTQVADEITAGGGRATFVTPDELYLNARELRTYKPLPQLEKGGYDQLAIYLGLAFYSDKRQPIFLHHALQSVDYANGGEAHFISSDFSRTFASAEGDKRTAAIFKAVRRFFDAADIDEQHGSELMPRVEAAIENTPELEAVESVSGRKEGDQAYWYELKDFLNKLADECDEYIRMLATEDRKNKTKEDEKTVRTVKRATSRALRTSELLSVKKNLLAKVKTVEAIIKLDEDKRPRITPPSYRTVTVRHRADEELGFADYN